MANYKCVRIAEDMLSFDRSLTYDRELTDIQVSERNPAFSSVDGVLYSKDGKTLIFVPSGRTGTVRVGPDVHMISAHAFSGGSLEHVILPPTLESLGKGAFSHCSSLTGIEIPDGVPVIDEDTFWGCRALEHIRLPASTVQIAPTAFHYCPNLLRIEVSPGNPSYCSVDGVLYSADRQTLVRFPAGREGQYTVPAGVRVISQYAFFGSGLSSIVLPEGAARVEDDAFQACDKLASVTLPDSITAIGFSAFFQSPALTELRLPKGMRSIPDGFFNYFPERCRVLVPDDHPAFSSAEDVLFSRDGRILVWCPRYKTGNYMIPRGTERVFSYAFGRTGLSSVTIPDSVRSLDSHAFDSARNLTGITIPSGVASIGDLAFFNCGKLRQVTVEEGVTAIGHGAFSNCISLDSVSFPGSAVSLGDNVFRQCSASLTVTVPRGSRAMDYCMQNFLKYRFPGEETVYPIRTDKPSEAYVRTRFNDLSMYMNVFERKYGAGDYTSHVDVIAVGPPDVNDIEQRIDDIGSEIQEYYSDFEITGRIPREQHAHLTGLLAAEVLSALQDTKAELFLLSESGQKKYHTDCSLLVRAAGLHYILKFDWYG